MKQHHAIFVTQIIQLPYRDGKMRFHLQLVLNIHQLIPRKRPWASCEKINYMRENNIRRMWPAWIMGYLVIVLANFVAVNCSDHVVRAFLGINKIGKHVCPIKQIAIPSRAKCLSFFLVLIACAKSMSATSSVRCERSDTR